MQLNNYNDFVKLLLSAGFSMGGGNDEGIYAVVGHGWQEIPEDSPVIWHTGDPETDPWEWRIRVLDERGDISYAKCFFRKSGYISEEYYPYFLAVRRAGREFTDEYDSGMISHYAKRIYDVVREYKAASLREIKLFGGFGRDEKSKFDSALTELQMRMYLTICSARRRKNKLGEEYGWETTVFCTTERFWERSDVFSKTSKLTETDAFAAIRERVLKLNPNANEKQIRKFAYGR